MKLADKFQDITLMNSKCSQANNEAEISVARAILKNLKDNNCTLHNQQCRFYHNRKLMCPSCFSTAVSGEEKYISSDMMKKYEFVCSLETILNHPIILVINRKELLEYPLEIIELIITSYKHIYEKKSDFKLKKSLIQSFISRLKSRIDSLCDEILCTFHELEVSLSKQTVLKDELGGLNAMYEGQLLEMLGENFTQSQKNELENILNEYADINESPFAKIKQNIDEMIMSLAEDHLVNVAALEKIYLTVTDQLLWNPKKLIVSRDNYFLQKFERAHMILTDDQIRLQKQYVLKMQQEKLQLFMDNQEIGRLDIHIDSLYPIPHYKLVGVNYNKLFIISYFDQLIIEDQFSITGCTDVLPFPNHIIVVSNQNLIKIDLTTRNYVSLGWGYTDLIYCKDKSYLFACQNQHGITTYWNVWSDKPELLWL